MDFLLSLNGIQGSLMCFLFTRVDIWLSSIFHFPFKSKGLLVYIYMHHVEKVQSFGCLDCRVEWKLDEGILSKTVLTPFKPLTCWTVVGTIVFHYS